MRFIKEEFTIKDWNIEAQTGYKPITTYYTDFSIADNYGEKAIMDTYKRSMELAKTDYRYLTELVMALNWKIWEHYNHNDKYARLYNDLWEQTDEYAMNTLKDEELSYFFDVTD